ncbi:MAG: thioredoxin family protein [Calditrichae bacterium]|nr:thioredoxin family protein [Calditrichota bacterium]MCB9058345.1 thioredoxin family protein [Calditrichia bacterium]
MHKRIILFTLLVTGFILHTSMFASEKAQINKAAPDFILTDSHGKTHSLSQYKGKIVVLEWVNFGCPFVRKHYNGKNMQALQQKYTSEDIVWLSICSSAPGKQGYYRSNDELNKKLAEEGHEASAYLIDASGDVGRMYDAKTTPHMYIINKEGILVYDGAIDDKPSAKLEDLKEADNYVSNKLDILIAGKEVDPETTNPYGCGIKY